MCKGKIMQVNKRKRRNLFSIRKIVVEMYYCCQNTCKYLKKVNIFAF
jgi:hypothetical protein